MKLSRYKQFVNSIRRSKVALFCRKYHLENYTINDDVSIDVNGDVSLYSGGLTKLPLKFRNVSGDFYCHDNKLTSLEGCPQSIGGDFDCSGNHLTSLKGCPQSVGGDFYCQRNKLTSLEGFPKILGGYILCYNNKIMNFKGLPEFFESDFSFEGNPVDEILKLFRNNKKSIYWIIEHDVIQGNKVIYNRLEAVAYELKMDLTENIKLNHYEII